MLDSTGLGAGPGDMLSEELGSWKVDCVTFTNQSKQDMYSNLNKVMEQGRLKFPMNRKMYYELVDLRYEISSSGNLKIHHPERGHDDYPDALALAVYSMYEEDVVAEYVPFIR
jgi:phage FluMu gp28-like protein